jgi:uncharacterized protein YeaC (DUF1315 family)
MDLLEKEKQNCIQVIKNYNLKYNTNELKKMYLLYDYLLLQLENETTSHVKMQLQEDIEIIMEYICPDKY